MWALTPRPAHRGWTYWDKNNHKTDQQDDEQASRIEIQDKPAPRGQSLGPLEEPLEPPRLRARAARAAAQEALRLRHAADGEAEAQGLLRQYRRAPVPPPLRGGVAPPRRHRRAADRAAGASPRRGGLSHEIRADRLRRPA